tara:strand:+ start:94 stop:495 length:402 start_codon:yes stop_codon:yes gene_type:complete
MINKIKKFFGFSVEKNVEEVVEQRPISDLLTLVRNNIQDYIKKDGDYSGGICFIIDELNWEGDISDDEHSAVDEYIIKWFMEDSDRPYFDFDVEVHQTDEEPFTHGTHYFWRSTDYQSRLDWLEEEITKLNKN